MTVEASMKPVKKFKRFSLYRASGRGFKYPGLHLWTGKGHRQVWPLYRFWRNSDR